MAQLVECLTLDFGSGHELVVLGIEPPIWLCADSMGPAWDSLSPPLSAPLLSTCTLSVSQNKYMNLKKIFKVLLHFHIFVNFPVFFLLLIFSFIPL